MVNRWETVLPDQKAISEAQARWDSVAKPLHSLGKLVPWLRRWPAYKGLQRYLCGLAARLCSAATMEL